MRVDLSILKKNKKNIIFVLIMLVLTVFIINRNDIIYNFNSLKDKKAMVTSYDTVTDFQNARWKEIQNNIFGEGVATSVTDTSLATKPVINGNIYFNWTDTTSLGIESWDGTVNKPDGTAYTQSDFYIDGALKQETVNYQTIIVDGVVDTREVTYDVYNVYDANQLRYVLTSTANTSNNKKIYLQNNIDLGGKNNVLWSSISTSGGDIYIEGNGYTIYNLNSGLIQLANSIAISK